MTKKSGAYHEHLDYLLQHKESKIILAFNDKKKLRGFLAGVPKEDQFYLMYCLGKTVEETEQLFNFSKINLSKNYDSIVIFDHNNKVYYREEL